ncbi:hypothetical protein DUI87_33023 [Hirundo rustica rustica]|uniref:Uncharacterized protein n=1 Tax=Hirundo rustica rustica TaxID=333673 RepID=A0A3M0IMH5_HIRRU|nr:hypothetical protein DUI87_33023 [Hirundo rustica rustica]
MEVGLSLEGRIWGSQAAPLTYNKAVVVGTDEFQLQLLDTARQVTVEIFMKLIEDLNRVDNSYGRSSSLM